MASLEGFQLLPIPEQVFLPSTPGIGGPVNFFIPSQPPLLQCLQPSPYTLMPGAFPQMSLPIFPTPELPPFYDYSNQHNFQQYVVDTIDTSFESDDKHSYTSSQGRENTLSNASLRLDHWSWVEQLNFILRDIYRFCETEQSVSDCQLVLDILINSNKEFFDLHSKLQALQEKTILSEGSVSSQHSNRQIISPTQYNSSHNNSLILSCTDSPSSDDVIDSTEEAVTEPTTHSHTNSPLLGIQAPNPSALATQTPDSDNVPSEITPLVDPPQQLWSQVIQRAISHNSSQTVSPTPGFVNHRNHHTAYTTIADQRIEVGPGFSTIYPSGVDHRLGQQSRNRQKQLSEKLASSNKKSPRESRETLEQRMTKAKEQRNKINEERQDRLRLQRTKVKEMQASKDEERVQKRIDMQAKLQGANDRRQSHLNELRRKAQEEERKVSEIHLINQMGASSRKLELQDELERKQQCVTGRKEGIAMSKKQQYERRIQSITERKEQLKAEQEARLAQLAEERKQREIRQQQKREMKEKARLEEALSKDLTLERKKAVKKYILQESVNFPKLPVKSKKKRSKPENETEKSTSCNTFPEAILPFFPYTPSKICKICNTKLHSELYLLAHFRSSRHHEALENIENCEEKNFKLGDRWFIEDITDTEDIKSLPAELQGIQKADKKKAKKLKLKLEAKFPKIKPIFDFRTIRSNNAMKLQFSKTFTSFSRILISQTTPVEKMKLIEENFRQLTEVKIALLQTDTRNTAALLLIQNDGLNIFGELFIFVSNYIDNYYEKITTNFWQIIQTTVNCLTTISTINECNCVYIIASVSYITCLDIFLQLVRLWVARWGSYMLYYYQMQSPSHNRMKEDFEYIGATDTLLSLFNFILVSLQGLSEINRVHKPILHEMCLDLINYALSIGLMDQIFVIFNVVCGPMENTDTESIVLKSMEILEILTCHLKKDSHIISNTKQKHIETPHTQTFSTKLKQFPSMNVTSLLYSIILHSGPPKPQNASPPKLSERTVAITTIAFGFINNAFLINHTAMQTGVGSDETRVNEFKLLVSYLIGYSKFYGNNELLDQLIISVGYFVLFSTQNQDAIQSGRLPTILQHLVDLPFKYFSSPELKDILFPTLIAATFDNENNRDTLSKDVNLKMLSVYMDQQVENHCKGELNKFGFKCRFPIEDVSKVYEFFGIEK